MKPTSLIACHECDPLHCMRPGHGNIERKRIMVHLRYNQIGHIIFQVFVWFLGSVVFSGSILHAKTITITHPIDHKPYIFVDENGESKGMLADFWRLWAEKTNVEIKFIPLHFQECLELVKDGKADMVGGLFYSSERDQHLDFSKVFAQTAGELFVSKELKVESIETFADIVVGVVKGYFADEFLPEAFPFLTWKSFASNEEVVKSALAGDIQAFVLDYLVGMHLLTQYDTSGRIKRHKTLYIGELRGGVKDGNAEMIALIDAGIDKISKKEINKIFKTFKLHDSIFTGRFKSLLPYIIFSFLIAVMAVYIVFLKKQIRQKKIKLQDSTSD
jgi:ABC-type amino acid transport substrate-binding protein